MLESAHYKEMKELKRLHREELEEETYQVAKKKEREKFVFEKENYALKTEIGILKNQVAVLDKHGMISNRPVLNSTTETADEGTTEKEGIGTDSIYHSG